MPGRIPKSAPARNRPAGNATTQPRSGATVLYSVSKPKWRNGRRAGLKNRWEAIPCQFESDLRHHFPCGRGVRCSKMLRRPCGRRRVFEPGNIAKQPPAARCRNPSPAQAAPLGNEPGPRRTLLAAANARLGAPPRRQPPHALIGAVIKPQQVAQHPPVQQGPVSVRVGQVCQL